MSAVARNLKMMKRRRWPKLPDPQLCQVFILTERGVIVGHVLGDTHHPPFRKSSAPGFWRSWERQAERVLRLLKRRS